MLWSLYVAFAAHIDFGSGTRTRREAEPQCRGPSVTIALGQRTGRQAARASSANDVHNAKQNQKFAKTQTGTSITLKHTQKQAPASPALRQHRKHPPHGCNTTPRGSSAGDDLLGLREHTSHGAARVRHERVPGARLVGSRGRRTHSRLMFRKLVYLRTFLWSLQKPY